MRPLLKSLPFVLAVCLASKFVFAGTTDQYLNEKLEYTRRKIKQAQIEKQDNERYFTISLAGVILKHPGEYTDINFGTSGIYEKVRTVTRAPFSNTAQITTASGRKIPLTFFNATRVTNFLKRAKDQVLDLSGCAKMPEKPVKRSFDYNSGCQVLLFTVSYDCDLMTADPFILAEKNVPFSEYLNGNATTNDIVREFSDDCVPVTDYSLDRL